MIAQPNPPLPTSPATPALTPAAGLVAAALDHLTDLDLATPETLLATDSTAALLLGTGRLLRADPALVHELERAHRAQPSATRLALATAILADEPSPGAHLAALPDAVLALALVVQPSLTAPALGHALTRPVDPALEAVLGLLCRARRLAPDTAAALAAAILDDPTGSLADLTPDLVRSNALPVALVHRLDAHWLAHAPSTIPSSTWVARLAGQPHALPTTDTARALIAGPLLYDTIDPPAILAIAAALPPLDPHRRTLMETVALELPGRHQQAVMLGLRLAHMPPAALADLLPLVTEHCPANTSAFLFQHFTPRTVEHLRLALDHLGASSTAIAPLLARTDPVLIAALTPATRARLLAHGDRDVRESVLRQATVPPPRPPRTP